MRVCKHSLLTTCRRTYGGLVGLTLLFGAGVFTSVSAYVFPRSAPSRSAKQQAAPVPVAEVDTDGDGLSDFQEIHKYFTKCKSRKPLALAIGRNGLPVQTSAFRPSVVLPCVLDLIARFDVVYIEKLNITGMLKNHHLARAIMDAGWGLFFSVLKSQAARAVRRVIEVQPQYTSQNCSACGEYVPKALSCRIHSCPYCGLVLHRDSNAARNI